ncbi:hydroxyacylglutathione hydrolase [Idiomarina loihiensis]|uniref:hydroxyacylglutathione hydrolase n=1 Tax=Idiomarina TaxID=135575 RepID=UPI000D7122AC|nr:MULTISPECIES: hydroxyacylglutathione hydrolase [Idiomarina]PWW36356.1 hydroxyacylglutathione hydrolase [Idiomarina loihiensis]TDP46586.1 hydroxyacylglutathione hydrolase [Idiomarina loihiensis]TDS22806.1 hydroxyacylglutathione hydrolase [Idiomarina sp. H2]
MRVHAIEAFDDNYIWAIETNDKNKVIIVDPGEAQPVQQWLEQNSKSIETILVTHHHYDHTGGIAELIEQSPCPVIGPENPEIETLTQTVTEGDELTVGGIQWQVLTTPGHTLDHISFYTPGFLFCGDTLFSGGCGRMFEGTPEQFTQSLLKLRKLPGETRVFCAHEYTQANVNFALKVEPENAVLQSYAEKVRMLREQEQITLPSTLQLELAINPFLRFDQKSVIAAANKHAESVKNSPEDVFYTIRQWKDNA